VFFRIFSIISWHFHRKQNQSDPNQPSLISIAIKLSYNYYIGYVIMKHAKEKGATAQQAFPFLACFNEQIFLRSRKVSSARADLRVCSISKKGAAAQQTFPFLACFNEQIFLRSRKVSSARADLLFHLSDQFSGKNQCTLKIF